MISNKKHKDVGIKLKKLLKKLIVFLGKIISMNTIAFIPARSGSSRLNKNIIKIKNDP